jgi:hypothetical protein
LCAMQKEHNIKFNKNKKITMMDDIKRIENHFGEIDIRIETLNTQWDLAIEIWETQITLSVEMEGVHHIPQVLYLLTSLVTSSPTVRIGLEFKPRWRAAEHFISAL